MGLFDVFKKKKVCRPCAAPVKKPQAVKKKVVEKGKK